MDLFLTLDEMGVLLSSSDDLGLGSIDVGSQGIDGVLELIDLGGLGLDKVVLFVDLSLEFSAQGVVCGSKGSQFLGFLVVGGLQSGDFLGVLGGILDPLVVLGGHIFVEFFQLFFGTIGFLFDFICDLDQNCLLGVDVYCHVFDRGMVNRNFL